MVQASPCVKRLKMSRQNGSQLSCLHSTGQGVLNVPLGGAAQGLRVRHKSDGQQAECRHATARVLHLQCSSWWGCSEPACATQEACLRARVQGALHTCYCLQACEYWLLVMQLLCRVSNRRKLGEVCSVNSNILI